MWGRFWQVNRVAGELMKRGYVVFSPISMTHPIAGVCSLPGTWDFWKLQDLPFLDWADELHVLCISGWDTSVGVTAEVEYFRAAGKPINYVDPEEIQ
ncbi:MAG: DUF1937 family protein [Bacteroidales bacterium]|nr:DUF1937 family protein [Bacteroidales bacterium]